MKFNFEQEPGKTLIQQEQKDRVEPLVSIITPFFNSGEFFEQTFNCVINQTFPWFEWIIVDDGSTNTEDIKLINDLSGKDMRIRMFHKENEGIASARNHAIKHSKTDFIVPLDADDLISPTYLEINYWALTHDLSAAWSYTDSIGFGTQNYLWKKKFSSEIMKVNNSLTCTAMIRKSAFKQVGFYSELIKHFNEDWYAWLKLLSKRFYPVHIEGYHFWYRRNDFGVLSKVNKNKAVKKKSLKVIKKIARKVKYEINALEFPYTSNTELFLPPVTSDFSLQTENTKYASPNLLMIVPWLEMGGADYFNLSFARYAANAKLKLGIITTNYSENKWKQRFESIISAIYELPNFMKLNDYAEFISYYILSRKVTTVLITNSYYGYYLIPWLKKNFPTLNVIDYVHMEEWYWRNGGYARTSGVFGALLAKTFVCCNATKKVLVESFNREPNSIYVSYIGVDLKYFDKNKVPANQIKKHYNLINKKIILFPCRLEPQKRPHLMLKIVYELKKQMTDFAVLIVGDGPMMEELKIEVKKLLLTDFVIFAGRQNDMRPYYRDSALTLICSLKEGLTLTAYESFSMGVPVIASDVGGQSELIDSTVGALIPLMQEETEYDSITFKKEEVQLYVNNIIRLLSDENYYNELSENCRRRIEKNFYVMDMLQALFENIKTLERKSLDNNQLKIPNFDELTIDLVTLYSEFENRINYYNSGINRNDKRELARIMNSTWGQRLIKIAFALKINKIFK